MSTSQLKIVFLDIDGVICTDASILKPKIPYPPDFHIPFRYGWDQFSASCVSRLNKITEATGAKLVISSTWRLACHTDEEFKYLIDYLHSQGIKANIIDKTPSHLEYSGLWGSGMERIKGRGKEIQEWLDTWKGEKVESFVILDDDNDMEHLSDFLVLTSESRGLQDDDVEQAIKILNQ